MPFTAVSGPASCFPGYFLSKERYDVFQVFVSFWGIGIFRELPYRPFTYRL